MSHQTKMSRCRQRERTSCLLVLFAFLTVGVGKDDERSEMIQIQEASSIQHVIESTGPV